MKKINGILKSKKLKYGSLSILFSVVVIAVIIVANVVITSFAQKYSWYSDLTKAGIYSVSDAAKPYLERLKAPIEIKFSMTEDQIKSNTKLTMVYQCAKEFEKESDLIRVSYFDTQANPAEFAKYKQLITTTWQNTNVIVESGANASVYMLDAFFSSSSGELVGFSGERKFVSAFLQLAGAERPIVTFTTGHGEALTGDYSDFLTMFDDLGFERRQVDLTKEDIDPECNLLIILDPVKDFVGKNAGDIESLSEIDKIEKFLEGFGSLMVFKGVTGTAFPVLDEYLSEWGIKIDSEKILKDVNPLTSDGYGFAGTYVDANTTAASVTKNIRNLRTVFYQAAPVEILFTDKETEAMSVAPMYTTSGNASCYADAENYSTGMFNLATLSMKTAYVENVQMYAYVFASGSPRMLETCGSQSYANRELMRTLIGQLSKAKNIVDLDYKPFEDYGLASITADSARNWTILLAGVIPVVVLAVGCVVCIRRKYK